MPCRVFRNDEIEHDGQPRPAGNRTLGARAKAGERCLDDCIPRGARALAIREAVQVVQAKHSRIREESNAEDRYAPKVGTASVGHL